MLTIRLQRTGTKNKSAFRIVLTEAHRAASKKVLEVLGHYNPRLKQFGIKDAEKLNYWLGKHVSVSPTVYNLLVDKKIVSGKKVKAWQPKKKEGEPAPTSEAVGAPTSAEPSVGVEAQA
ncbi:MAG: 30S ribosomal protein S16 [Candidatus Doudnabacteria bacterium RIFCSPLOWO2_02_FULL_49_13]|uniref:30S ribosomal protein S16 n=1 Tax=Candidatus Doudnabacteria bacterium RIFCSPHIGHO2_12_FULL_48_16 TaxID=1817838 RepID=A0A1F5PKB9_9BACT|nr:MAG: 30S ribosomal protein S16 [Candidatus Doudnabacteria bacterium RIFCSPHIGHO2_02_FULL_49_24]OGE88698.1 MAG: 30S ribosomal protein S16 [Candidatus Doudnabacteria bacterium RIFCSPHIGHO2_01_FULL_50_67]OGE90383.1 MAG: 30S ribosomal protein S16 [Candidatus Doudnabacteria bacterium RIFCSPHIGHO2_12_FULL_48_16]OGE97090.1 MAG: 30S ribosomal protein S16 [Candidatus Doudnabacteria bacterium RIFCSPLOWO2_01_FULL_49_40]OGF02439.1 MAG: 30S ribosomal protein S16 [Candidatus Doudnabacteria bacterium RIFCS